MDALNAEITTALLEQVEARIEQKIDQRSNRGLMWVVSVFGIQMLLFAAAAGQLWNVSTSTAQMVIEIKATVNNMQTTLSQHGERAAAHSVMLNQHDARINAHDARFDRMDSRK